MIAVSWGWAFSFALLFLGGDEFDLVFLGGDGYDLAFLGGDELLARILWFLDSRFRCRALDLGLKLAFGLGLLGIAYFTGSFK
jgi:hypothetical protein